MYDQPSIARYLYRWTAFAAIPGTLWSAFEMYVLTLNGAQMLFFSIVHTMPLLVVVVLVGVVALALWAIQSTAALLLASYRAKVDIPASALAAFAALAILHLALLFSYESWSSGYMRIAACLLGLAAMCCLLVLCVGHLRRAGKAHAGT